MPRQSKQNSPQTKHRRPTSRGDTAKTGDPVPRAHCPVPVVRAWLENSWAGRWEWRLVSDGRRRPRSPKFLSYTIDASSDNQTESSLVPASYHHLGNVSAANGRSFEVPRGELGQSNAVAPLQPLQPKKSRPASVRIFSPDYINRVWTERHAKRWGWILFHPRTVLGSRRCQWAMRRRLCPRSPQRES